ncbi:MAG: exosome complex protein Rrp4 [Candidatus Caldarchaeum sp.]|nr:exosome complex protein Rrp4 [Candidatus Caldarchaeum sp.]
MLYFRENDLVIPGQLLADNGRRSGYGTYTRDGKLYASTTGLVRVVNDVVRIIPLSGRYKPQRGDRVVGIVSDVKPNVVEVDISGELTAVIKPPERETTPLKIDIGDCVYAEVKSVGIRGTMLSIEGLQKIPSGILVKMNPAKIPRLIGRKGSMVQMLRKESGCDFWVGRNGLVVVSGPDPGSEFAAVSAINLIEREAHVPGLTEKVINLLRRLRGGAIE